MTITQELLAILACPSADHAPLTLRAAPGADGQADGEELVCTFCGSSFPIRDSIPVLLPDEATPGPNGLGVAAAGPANEGSRG